MSADQGMADIIRRRLFDWHGLDDDAKRPIYFSRWNGNTLDGVCSELHDFVDPLDHFKMFCCDVFCFAEILRQIE